MRTAILVILFVAAVCAELAPLIVNTQSGKVIEGAYIVVLKDSLTVLNRDAHILALKDTIATTKDTVSEIGFTYKIGSLIGFSAKLSESLLKSELAHPDVKYIEADQVVSINDGWEQRAPLDSITQTGATWGLDRIDQRALPLDGNYVYNSVAGSGVDIYIIDTGILTTHQDFGTRASSVFNAITTEAPTDLNGHGTHCAGTAAGTTYGVAKLANLYSVKVLSAGGSGTWAGVIAGVDYVTNNMSPSRPSVASMSLGGGAAPTVDTAVQNSIAAGVTYSIAAGNSNADACLFSPARVSTAITVGATTNTDARASYSNIGTCVDIFAPGSSITSDWIGSGNNAINTISGTSMATPHVTGVAAIQLSLDTSMTPAQVAAQLTSLATPNVVTNPGTGSPNLLLYSPSQ